jgi:hypothetical protein
MWLPIMISPPWLATIALPASLLCQMPSSLTFVIMLDVTLSDMIRFSFQQEEVALT